MHAVIGQQTDDVNSDERPKPSRRGQMARCLREILPEKTQSLLQFSCYIIKILVFRLWPFSEAKYARLCYLYCTVRRTFSSIVGNH